MKYELTGNSKVIKQILEMARTRETFSVLMTQLGFEESDLAILLSAHDHTFISALDCHQNPEDYARHFRGVASLVGVFIHNYPERNYFMTPRDAIEAGLRHAILQNSAITSIYDLSMDDTSQTVKKVIALLTRTQFQERNHTLQDLDEGARELYRRLDCHTSFFARVLRSKNDTALLILICDYLENFASKWVRHNSYLILDKLREAVLICALADAADVYSEELKIVISYAAYDYVRIW